MITQIGNYKLGEGIDSLNLKPLSKDSLGPLSSNIGNAAWHVSNLHEAGNVLFLDFNWQVVLGVYQDKIYKIALQAVIDDEQGWNSLFDKTIAYLKNDMGKYDKHPLFSKTYIWKRQEGFVVLQKDRVLNALGINLYVQNNIFNVNF